jgi:hypothetical protein
MAEIVLKGSRINIENEYRVFVAGIPSSLKYLSIKEYFSMIGPISRVEPISRSGFGYSDEKHSENLDAPCKKGCCIIVTSCQETYRSILEGGNYKLLGRQLICRKYLQSDELAEHNKQTNQQRLLLKKVPSTVSEVELKSFLEKVYGRVQIIYVFKTQKIQGGRVIEKAPRNFVTYSVTFESSAPASKLIERGRILGPQNCTITVQQFHYYPKERPSNAVSTTQQHITASSSIQRAKGLYRGNLSSVHQESSKKSIQLKALFSVPTQEEADLFKEELVLTPTTTTLLSHHHIKPTMKKYFIKSNYTYSSHAQLLSNLTFNIRNNTQICKRISSS